MSDDLAWRWTGFDGLSGHDVYDLLALRQRVFVVEQACAYLDADGRDASAMHLLARDARGALLGCLRVLPPGGHFEVRAIGRVVTAPEARALRLGHGLMREALARIEGEWGEIPLALAAQAHLTRFYAAHGFVAASEPYDEDGIPHIDMRRPVTRRG